jgi:type IV pilus assembly protein PilW
MDVAGQRGVTLVELMVALVLGLVVSGAALALFMTNKQVYTASENLDRIQEASRSAFELMARDLREADGNPCSDELTLNNELNSYATYAWWSDWGDGLKGYTGAEAFADKPFGTGEGDRVAGTPAVELWSAEPTTENGVLRSSMANTTDELDVSDTTGISANDILVICGPSAGLMSPPIIEGTIFQATGIGTHSIKHQASGTPGNADGSLHPEVYGANAIISKLHAVRWYIGYNGRTDPRDGSKLKSLYRMSLDGSTVNTNEIVQGVTDLRLSYHVRGDDDYVESPAASSWGDVDAVEIQMDLAGPDKAGTDQDAIKRSYQHVVAIRSRAP